MSRLLSASLVLALVGPAVAQDGPPQTERQDLVETLHDTPVADPYRWLEGDDEGGLTPAVEAWTDAQNAYTRSVLDGLPGRAALEARLRELMTVGAIGLPKQAGPWVFYSERTGEQNQPVYYVREGADGDPRVLIDPNTLDDEGLVSLDWTEPSPDGALLAFGLSRAGDENSTLHVLEVATGTWRADAIPNKAGDVSWLPDGRRFVYSCLDDVSDPYSRRVRLHTLGQHPRHDAELMAQHSTTWGPFGGVSPDGRWLLLGYWTSTRANDLWAVDFERYLRTGELERITISEGGDGSNFGFTVGDTLYLISSEGTPRRQVRAIDLGDPSRSRVVIPEHPTAVLERVYPARGLLVVEYLDQASTRVERFRLDGTPVGALELPGIGTASVRVSENRTDGWVRFASYDRPTTIYQADFATGALTPWAQVEVPVDPESVVVRRVTYPSKDGTEVSMFLVHAPEVELNGDNPVLLYGYGGFNISLTPYFSATLFPWFEAGGIYAVPHLRGGGEYGDAWHTAGMLDQKQNVFDDFIAAAEWLIDEGYTRPERLAVAGGSNGGLLTGAVVVQRPDLFAAAISAVPLLDMLRYHRFLMARFWVPEYGSAEDPEQFGFLRAYSPYQRVEDGVEYPAVLLTAGENDTRVHPLHARKMAAALQHATTSDPAVDPILLWVDRDAGHGSGKPLSLRLRDVTDQRLFVMWQTGVTFGE